MNRIPVLFLLFTAGLALGSTGASGPPRVIYSNDATNLINAPAPGMQAASMSARLETTVAEAGGADLHLLQPGNGWVPWWRSTQYPADAHYRRFEQRAGRAPDSIGEYMSEGGDLVAEFIRACRARGVAAGVSLRLNDYHGSESWDVLRAFARGEHRNTEVPVGLGAMAAQSDVLLEHPENQLHPDPAAYTALAWPERLAYAANPATRITLRTARVWNWARPEVPDYKQAFVRELCDGYDLDALELDFMRWSSYFRLEEVPVAKRRAIMLKFIRETRAALDRSARPGQRRLLGVRVPSRLSGHDPLGIDLVAWVAAGVDWVNLSCHYVSEQQTDLARVRELIPETPLYLELTFANTSRRTERRVSLDGTEEAGGYGLMTAEQFFTAAHLAYARGAAGVSLFNFAYYRNLGDQPHEPPFDVLARLGDRDWLARQPQHYFLSMSASRPSGPSEFTRHRHLVAGQVSGINIDLAPPAGGWQREARLQIEVIGAWGERAVEVWWNGRRLGSATEATALLTSPFGPQRREDSLRAWAVPAELLRAGENRIEVKLSAGDRAEIRLIELMAP